MFVKKNYHEGHNKNKNYSFKQALKDKHVDIVNDND